MNADIKIKDMPDLTVAKLYPICSEFIGNELRGPNFYQGICIGMILGLGDNARYDKKICIPENISIRE
jgi:hypothetical protein